MVGIEIDLLYFLVKSQHYITQSLSHGKGKALEGRNNSYNKLNCQSRKKNTELLTDKSKSHHTTTT